MTSQAPTTVEEGVSEDYKAAWDATRILTVQNGFSWSGRERNHAFLNLGNGRFADVSRLSNCDCIGDGRSVAVLDWDDDGRLDFLLRNRTGPRVQLFHNRYGGAGDFLVVELEGNGDTTNRDAIGAQVELQLAGTTQRRTLRAGEGFLSQSTKKLHFGLGSGDAKPALRVRWTDGTSTRIEAVERNSRVRIVQRAPDDDPRGEHAPHLSLEVAPQTTLEVARWKGTTPRAATSAERRVVLAYPLPLAELPLPAYGAPERRVADLAGAPLLVNFWQTTCAPCLTELAAFGREREALGEAGLQLVPMNLDELLEDVEPDPEAASQRLDTYGLGDLAGESNEELREALFVLWSELFGERSNLSQPMPTSYLLDAQGRLLLVYLGPVDPHTLLEDVSEIQREDPRPVLDRLAHGTRILHYKREFDGLARRLGEAGLRRLSEYFRGIDEVTYTYVWENGARRDLKGRAESSEEPPEALPAGQPAAAHPDGGK